MTSERHVGRSRDLLLRDIVDFANRLASHLDGAALDRFRAERMRFDAVIRCIEVVGEASGQLLAAGLDDAIRHLEPQLRAAYSTRNRLIHGYSRLSDKAIWDTATVSVPALAAAIRAVIPPDPA